ncbi:MAG: hypothetical protein G3M78_04900 [Candidatus Nitrohelix vancouverensis]|uniref:Glycosyltransferase RgtA/B/C/D-like domain-containing protein n=1 Tax=Candidatus Nitrohelix vancouverensis TaxID=2705534 RepID=A0A7T0G2V8_9BACT|nr:MAG: hypothetical protein G3M78_04900 [Candidatus Nitrohelix vancouverensis]
MTPHDDSHSDETAFCLSLFLFFACFYLLFAQGSIQSADGKIMYRLTESMAERFSFNIAGPEQTEYSKYGLGMSALALPLYFIGKAVGGALGIDSAWATTFFVSLFNAFITPGVCVFVYLFGVRRLGFSRRTACILSLGFGLSTIAWAYSEEFMSEPATALFLIGSAYFVSQTGSEKRSSALWIAGAFMAIALTCRIASIMALPGFLLFILWTARPSMLHRLADGARFFVPIIAAALLIGLYNEARFGSFTETGYEHGLTPDLWGGLSGLLFSPGKSVFLYNPVLIAACFGLSALFRKRAQLAFLLGWIVLSHLMLFSFWHSWYGGLSWGPRLLLCVIPFAVLPAGYLLESGRAPGRRVLACIVLGVLIQLPASLVNMSRYHYQMQVQWGGEAERLSVHTLKHSPLIGQFRQVAEVARNLSDAQAMQQRVEMARAGTRFDSESVEEALKWGLAVNAPNVWWYYMRLFGYPALMTMGPPLALGILIFYFGFQLRSRLNADKRS